MSYFRNICFVLLLPAPVLHASPIALSGANYGGTGCPAGSVVAALSPDQSTVSIYFEKYMAQTGANKRLDRKACGLAIPLHVPAGYSVAVAGVDFEGFNSLPAGARARLSVEQFFAGATSRGAKVKTFAGPLQDVFSSADALGPNLLVWSACGKDTIVRVQSSLLLLSNTSRSAVSMIDRANSIGGLRYSLMWRRCH